MKAQLLRALFSALGSLPLPLLRALGQLTGSLLWLLPVEPRRIALHHLEKLFPHAPPPARRRIARRSLQAFATTLLESTAIWYGPRRRLLRWVDDAVAAQRLQALAGEQGAIILCPHIGNWELAGMFCARHGGITSLYKPQKGAADALVLAGRQRLGARLVASDGGGVRTLLTSLKQGGRIGMLPDQDPPRGAGDFVPLFGVPAHTPTLAQGLARRSGARVLFCYAERVGWTRFRFHLRRADTAAGELAAMNAAVEACIMHLPGQYWWAYRRYRRRPPGDTDFYIR